MLKTGRRWGGLLLAASLLLQGALGADACGDPSKFMQQKTETLLRKIEKANRSGSVAEKKRKRLEAIHEEIDPITDGESLSLRVLGPRFTDATLAKKRRFISAFTQFVAGFYNAAFSGTDIQNYTVKYRPARGAYGNRVEVYSKIDSKEGLPSVNVNYTLNCHIDAQTGKGQWKVEDFVVNGIDMAENYKAQFGRFSIEEITKLLEQKNKAYRAQ